MFKFLALTLFLLCALPSFAVEVRPKLTGPCGATACIGVYGDFTTVDGIAQDHDGTNTQLLFYTENVLNPILTNNDFRGTNGTRGAGCVEFAGTVLGPEMDTNVIDDCGDSFGIGGTNQNIGTEMVKMGAGVTHYKVTNNAMGEGNHNLFFALGKYGYVANNDMDGRHDSAGATDAGYRACDFEDDVDSRSYILFEHNDVIAGDSPYNRPSACKFQGTGITVRENQFAMLEPGTAEALQVTPCGNSFCTPDAPLASQVDIIQNSFTNLADTFQDITSRRIETSNQGAYTATPANDELLARLGQDAYILNYLALQDDGASPDEFIDFDLAGEWEVGNAIASTIYAYNAHADATLTYTLDSANPQSFTVLEATYATVNNNTFSDSANCSTGVNLHEVDGVHSATNVISVTGLAGIGVRGLFGTLDPDLDNDADPTTGWVAYAGDVINITGVGGPYTIRSVDHDNDQITLDTSITTAGGEAIVHNGHTNGGCAGVPDGVTIGAS